jgi:hypothetical protein
VILVSESLLVRVKLRIPPASYVFKLLFAEVHPSLAWEKTVTST